MKQQEKNALRRLIALLLVLVLCLGLVLTSMVVTAGATGETATETETAEETSAAETETTEETADTETITISTPEELIQLAKNCSLDTWSQNKVVELENDITLEGTDFTPIPTFGGTFKGNGYTISGLEITASGAPAGLFAQVQNGGIIQNLTVTGTVSPSGSAECVGGIAGQNNGIIRNCTFNGMVEGKISSGGIAGENTSSGWILSCTVSGTVTGSSMTGGICGTNAGMVQGCTNQAVINNESVDPTFSLEDIQLDLNLDLDRLSSRLSSLNQNNAPEDTGGIVGYSSGTILLCTNAGVVGYPHIGYNNGGIVGRSCGYVMSCQNTGTVNGRKDIGGIAGQAEPYTLTVLSESTIKELEEKLDQLDALIEQTREDAGEISDIASNRLSSMTGYANSAAAALGNMHPTATVTGSATAGGNVSSVGSGDASSSSSGETSGSAGSETEGSGSAEGASGSAAGIIGSDTSSDSGGVVISPGAIVGGSTSSDLGGAAAGTISGGSAEVEGSISSEQSGEASGSGESSASASGQVDTSGNVTASGSANISVNLDTSGVSAALRGMTGQMSKLNEELSGQSDVIDSDLDDMNVLMEDIQNTLLEAADADNLKNLVTDASDSDLSAITYGKVFQSENTGSVSGDLNVGGIAGSLSRETSVDPEDDLSEEMDTDQQAEYELKAVLQSCTNTGPVTGKRSYIGGIVGRMDLGLTTDCRNYGTVESESGDYVGGIAGLNRSVIRSCFTKATLKGGSYVGGITGSGIDAGEDGAGSQVESCMSLVDIPEAEEYCGAISGGAAGIYTENYFVSDTLAGLNGASYAGQAEPVTYTELVEKQTLPEAFQSLTLSFVADDVTLKEVEFTYGDSFDASIYPDIPEKEGYYARWDITDLADLYFNTTVTAVYTPYVTSLAGTDTRDDGRAVFLLQGNFTQADALQEEENDLSVGTEDLGIDGLEALASPKVVEQWTLTLPEEEQADPFQTDSEETVEQTSAEEESEEGLTLRYLPVDGEPDGYAIYLKEDGAWHKLDTEAVGSYLTFTVIGTQAEIAVVSTGSLLWLAIIAGGVLLAILVIIILIKVLKGRKKAARQKAKAKKPISKHRKRGRWALRILGILLVLVICGVVALCILRPDLKNKAETILYLKDLTAQEDLDLSLEVSAQANGEVYSLSADLWQTTEDGEKITCITRDGLSLYYADGAVFLEDGMAYAVGTSYPDVSQLLDLADSYFESPDLTTGEDGIYQTYTITLDREETGDVLELLCPAIDWNDALEGVTVRLYCSDGRADHLVFSASGTISLNAELDVLWDKNGDHTVPEAVLSAIDDGTRTDASPITKDVYRLLAAWAKRDSQEPLEAEVALAVDCGPVTISDSLTWARTEVNGQEIHRLTLAGQDIYFTNQSLCGPSGNAVTESEGKTAQCLKLLEIAYEAFQQGGMRCVEENGTYTYTLALTEEQMTQAALAIAPDLADVDISLTDGYFEAVVEDNNLISLRFNCGGSTTVLTAKLSASLKAEVSFLDADQISKITVPDAVKEALLGASN